MDVGSRIYGATVQAIRMRTSVPKCFHYHEVSAGKCAEIRFHDQMYYGKGDLERRILRRSSKMLQAAPGNRNARLILTQSGKSLQHSEALASLSAEVVGASAIIPIRPAGVHKLHLLDLQARTQMR
jgi:hypothetical protein